MQACNNGHPVHDPCSCNNPSWGNQEVQAARCQTLCIATCRTAGRRLAPVNSGGCLGAVQGRRASQPRHSLVPGPSPGVTGATSGVTGATSGVTWRGRVFRRARGAMLRDRHRSALPSCAATPGRAARATPSRRTRPGPVGPTCVPVGGRHPSPVQVGPLRAGGRSVQTTHLTVAGGRTDTSAGGGGRAAAGW